MPTKLRDALRRARSTPGPNADLDELERIAVEIQQPDGYPVRHSLDLRAFVASAGALAAWVAEDDGATVGHVALNPRSSDAVMARAVEVVGHGCIGVVARLLVAPSARRTGVAAQLLRTAAAATRQRGLHPVLDVVETFAAPRALYEREGWRDVGVVEAVFSEGFSVREVVYAAP